MELVLEEADQEELRRDDRWVVVDSRRNFVLPDVLQDTDRPLAVDDNCRHAVDNFREEAVRNSSVAAELHSVRTCSGLVDLGAADKRQSPGLAVAVEHLLATMLPLEGQLMAATFEKLELDFEFDNWLEYGHLFEGEKKI